MEVIAKYLIFLILANFHFSKLSIMNKHYFLNEFLKVIIKKNSL